MGVEPQDAGQPEDRTAKAKTSGGGVAGWGCLAVIVVFVVFGVALCSGGGDKGPDKYDTQVTCKELVRQQLKNPSTADFSDGQQSAAGASGTVVAENALGGKVTYSYACTLKGGIVELVDLTAR